MKRIPIKTDAIQVLAAQWDFSQEFPENIRLHADMKALPIDEDENKLSFGGDFVCSHEDREIMRISIRVLFSIPDRTFGELGQQVEERKYVTGLATELILGQVRNIGLMASQMSGQSGSLLLPTLLESAFFDQAGNVAQFEDSFEAIADE